MNSQSKNNLGKIKLKLARQLRWKSIPIILGLVVVVVLAVEAVSLFFVFKENIKKQYYRENSKVPLQDESKKAPPLQATDEKQGVNQPDLKKDFCLSCPDTPIVYVIDEEIYVANLVNGTRVKIDNGNFPTVAPDKSKVIYYSGDRDGPLDQWLFLYDFASEERTVLASKVVGATWSPNSKYVLVDSVASDTSPQRVLDLSNSNQEVLRFYASYGHGWLDNDEIVFTVSESLPPAPRPGQQFELGTESGKSIVKIDLQGNITKLQQGGELVGYEFLEVLNNNQIYFRKTEVKKNTIKAWQDAYWEQEGLTYLTMDRRGANVVEVAERDQDVEKAELVKVFSFQSFTDLGLDIYGYAYLNQKKNWVIFISHLGSDSDPAIYIANLKEPEDLKMFAYGQDFSW